MSSTNTNTPPTPVRQIPREIRDNAVARRVITSPVPAPATTPGLVHAGLDSVSNHSHEIFVQCLYMLPVVGNAMSLYDVGTDIYRLCSVSGASGNLFNWGILAVDAIGVVPAAGNASRPARAVVKEVLLAFAKGAAAGVLVDLFWATAGGDVIEFMSTLESSLKQWKQDIVKGVREASRTVRRFVQNPVSAAEQMGAVKKNTGFLSWVPSGEEIALHGIDELLKLSGRRDAILAWLDAFDRNTEPMLDKAFGDAAIAGTLVFMAAQIVEEIRARRAHKPSHVAQAAPGTMKEPHMKPGELPARKGCGCPSTASAKPVNYAMGDENLEQTDFALDGVVPIVWTRRYRSSLAAYDDSPLGARWSSPYHLSLDMKDGALVFFDADNRAVPLPPVETGESVDVPAEQLTVSRPDARRVRLTRPDGSREDYERHGTAARERYRLTARTSRDGLGLTFDYNDVGELVSISDGADNTIRLEYAGGRLGAIHRVSVGSLRTETLASYRYSPEGDLIEHQDILGHKRQFAYQHHLLVRYTDFNGRAANLEWDWPGRRSSLPAPADARCVRTWLGNDARDVHEDTHFEYHREHWYTKVTDATGNATFHRYDAHNRIVLVEHGDGSSERFDWDESHNLTGMRDALGQMQRFAYDASGRVIAVTDALGNTTRTEYSAEGLPITVTAANGDVTQTAYDMLGRPVSVTDAAGRTTQYVWSSAGRVLSLTDPKGGVKRFRYDNAGRLTEAVDCSGSATGYGYDERGYLSRRTDAEGHITAYRHDARGQLMQLTHPDGVEEHFTWDGEGNLTSYRDGAGQVTGYSFNMHRQPTLRKDAAGRRVACHYDSQWRLEWLRNESDEDTEFRYNALGQLIEQKDFDGRTTTYTYDDAGRLAGSREAGVETEFVRDPLGRLTQRHIRAPGTTHSERFYYDARGRLVTAQTESGRVQLHYDDAGNLIAEEQYQHPTTAAEYVTVTRHEYDALGNRTRTILPNTRTIDWLRYGAGHVHGVLVDGQPLVDFERDKLHRETARTHAAFTQQREYDPAGRLARFVARPASAASAHERIAERRLQYSAAGHLTRIEDRTRGVTGYTYDPVGRLLKSVTPDLTEIFAFDPAGNPVDPEKMTPPPVVETSQEKAERFAREAAEDAAWLRAHPGEKRPPLRDNLRAMEESTKLYRWKRSLPRCIGNVLAELNHVRYDYDRRGNLSRRIESDGRTWLYRYDAANRLTEASRYANAPKADELSRTRTLAQGGVEFINGTARAERVVRFRYDVFGRRTLKEVERAGGGIDRTLFTWDGDVLLMEERFHEPPRRPGDFRPYPFRYARLVREDPGDPHSLPVAQRMHTLHEEHQWQAASIYLHEPGSFVPLARFDETMVEPAHLATGTDGRFMQMPATTRHATLFYQNDHLGTPQELVDESGKVVWLARYKAWGGWKATWREKPDPAETGNALRFQGQYHDEETGLHYNRHRYYDPQTGRFISKDPIGLAGGINVYAYAPNPVAWIDPLGLTAGSGGHASGTARPPLTGATPNSIYTKSNAIGNVAVQNSVYDGNGNLIGQVDFKNHGGCACSGHAHAIDPPGSAASVAAAHGPGAPHILPANVPAEWKAIPPGMKPATPIGQ